MVLKQNNKPKIINKFTKEQVEEISKYLQKIYKTKEEDNFFIKIFSKSTKKKYFYDSKTLKDKNKLYTILNSYGAKNVYISLNQFRTMKNATKENVMCINAIAIDIDFKKIEAFKDLPPVNVIRLLEEEVFDFKLPYPNFIEYSNQLRLIYNLENCYSKKGRSNLHTLIERIIKEFVKRVKEYGAEQQGIESFIRVPWSINSKNKSTVEILDYNIDTYDLEFLKNEWLPDLPAWYEDWKIKQKCEKNKKVINLHNINILNNKILLMLEAIQLEKINSFDKDLRRRLCFLIRNYVAIVITKGDNNRELTQEENDEAIEQMLKFNSNFLYPNREHTITTDTDCIKRKRYLYKITNLLNLLELNENDCERFGFNNKTKTKEEISEYKKKYYKDNNKDIKSYKKEYYKENKEALKEKSKEYYEENKEIVKQKAKEQYKKKLEIEDKTTKSSKLEERRKKMKDLLAEGLSTKEICDNLQISKKTYLRDLKHIN